MGAKSIGHGKSCDIYFFLVIFSLTSNPSASRISPIGLILWQYPVSSRVSQIKYEEIWIFPYWKRSVHIFLRLSIIVSAGLRRRDFVFRAFELKNSYMYVFAILKRFSIFLLWKFLFSLCLSYINYSFIRE